MSSLRQSATALRSSVTARRAGQLAVDACLLALAYYLAYYLRFDDGHPAGATRTCSRRRSS